MLIHSRITDLCQISSFFSKILEKAANIRLRCNLSRNNLIDEFQSAYRPHHSTETALLRVLNELRCQIDSGKLATLVLLDLSAAFDTVDHTLLLQRVHQEMGIAGVPLAWLESYLRDRGQSVIIGQDRSDKVELTCGVPQGSVLEPVLFILYTSCLGHLIRQHEGNHQSYADDCQLIDSFQPPAIHEHVSAPQYVQTK